MKKVEYRFEITSKLLGEVVRIAEQGNVSYSFMYDLKQLYDESKFTPNKDMSWYLNRLIREYYSVELVAYDETFKEINEFLLNEWHKRVPDEEIEDKRKKVLQNSYIVAF